MTDNPLDKYIGDKRQALSLAEYKEMAIEQSLILMTNSINSVSVDLARRLLQQQIQPTVVEIAYKELQDYKGGLTGKKYKTRHVGRKISLEGWLVSDVSPSGWESITPGNWFVLCSNGAPFSYQYSDNNHRQSESLTKSGAKDFASAYLSSDQVQWARTSDVHSVDEFFEQYRHQSLDNYIKSLSPLIDKLV